ncbi:MAG: hypothetical protein A3H96_25190 [Acidobacteria bacterium RIFCSPLOWO2_02_FULL_67_36]|nr:MAG: hypothetical protein A3H96_25190 [Acidobacteria bacterium RIFCSPLOWO2_02_FULL_67_36]
MKFAVTAKMPNDLQASGSRPKLLDRVRDAIRARHYSRRTEVAYVAWIRRHIGFHRKAHPATLGAADIAAFLTWLARNAREADRIGLIGQSSIADAEVGYG